MEVLLLILVALLQCANSFHLVMSPYPNPVYGERKNSGVPLSAKKYKTIGGTLKPSDKAQNKLVFEMFIINRNFKSISEVAADVEFMTPTPSIFGKTYNDEAEFGVKLYEDRLQPMLENNQVLILMDSHLSIPVFTMS